MEMLTDTITRRATLTLPAAEDFSVSTSRHFADDQLRGWGLAEDERDSAGMIIGELAANAVQHGHADLTVSLAFEESTLVITVTDSGPEVVRESPRSQMPDDEHGRGAGIVEFLAAWTDVHDSVGGRRVRAGLRVTV